LKSDEGKIDADQAYFSPKLPTSIGGVVKVGNFMYGTNSAALMCVNFATGDIKWTDRSIGASSLVYAEGRLYLHGEKGDVALVEASPDAYHELGRFTPPKRPESGHAKAWAYPVIANGKLYIRELDCVWCYDIRQLANSK
jgi:outer membrane protein assembly factor BamB